MPTMEISPNAILSLNLQDVVVAVALKQYSSSRSSIRRPSMCVTRDVLADTSELQVNHAYQSM